VLIANGQVQLQALRDASGAMRTHADSTEDTDPTCNDAQVPRAQRGLGCGSGWPNEPFYSACSVFQCALVVWSPLDAAFSGGQLR
jgi:hypothetical protein